MPLVWMRQRFNHAAGHGDGLPAFNVGELAPVVH